MNQSPTQVRTAKERKAIAAKIAKNEKKIAENQKKLDELTRVIHEHTIDCIKKSLAVTAHDAPINESMSEQEARETIQHYLIDAPAVPIHTTVCEALTSFLNFDASLITYGKFKGISVGFIPGLPLLKFIGFLNFDAPTLQEAALLMKLNENDTKH